MQEIEYLSDLSMTTLRQFDDIIDVRSPSEFLEDHIPGSVNLPVLNDAEREEVGTIYCKTSRHDARRIGAGYVTKNISAHLSNYFVEKSNDYRPLIYCWRGGMRSASMATILSSVGWYTKVIESGYRAWRQTVIQSSRDSNIEHTFILIDGQTGTNKTKILHKLAKNGCQVIDLEGLAEHRGSVFGGLAHTKQPSQKYFESLLFHRLEELDQMKPIFVEAESPKIGRRALPKMVVEAMRRAPRIELQVNAKERAQNLVACYADLIESPSRLHSAIEYLRPYHPSETISSWLAMSERSDYESLAFDLIEAHYDPCYERQRKKRNDKPAKVINLDSLCDQSLELAAAEIELFSKEQEMSCPPLHQSPEPIQHA